MSTRVTRVAGFAIAERYAGSGPTVVFVHGLAVSGRYFVPTMRAPAQRNMCRAVDLPGFGRSDAPRQVLSVTGLADALAAWLRANRLTGAALVGNSAGCQYIVDGVTRHRDITGRSVLIGPTTDPTARTAAGQIGRWLRTAARRAQEVTDLLPRSRLFEISGGAHVVNFTRPADVAHAIDWFLRDPSGATA